MDSIEYIVLGAILALLGGIITQIVMVKWGDIRTRKSFILLISDLITQINTIIDDLNKGYIRTNMAQLAHLLNINNNLAVFGRNREFVIKLSNAELRKNIIEYFDKISITTMALQGFESLRSQPTQNNLVKTGIAGGINALIELRDKGNTIKSDLEKS